MAEDRSQDPYRLMPEFRQCRKCLEKVPTAEFAAHKAAHLATPPRTMGLLKPCNRCVPPQLIPGSEWVRHLQHHRNNDPARPRTRSGTYAWKKLREQVLARDGYRCRQCQSRENLEVHHLDGGSNWRDHSAVDAELVPMSRLVTLCRDCHDQQA